ncbi:hypothetical protein [Peribacillus simplex]|uniref:hypothetical protein n=1 Tax=Peribacillus simplex TaxID=1478 RepID=UPI0024C12BA6|nr:hypothetical protein [Peribacillus simplex]WHY56498.1 hypothetical protein QNH43_25965 [Peribacillus simplex]
MELIIDFSDETAAVKEAYVGQNGHLMLLTKSNKKPPIYVLVETVGVEPTSRHNGT